MTSLLTVSSYYDILFYPVIDIVAVDQSKDGYLRADLSLRPHMPRVANQGPPPSPALSIVSIGVS